MSHHGEINGVITEFVIAFDSFLHTTITFCCDISINLDVFHRVEAETYIRNVLLEGINGIEIKLMSLG